MMISWLISYCKSWGDEFDGTGNLDVDEYDESVVAPGTHLAAGQLVPRWD